MLAEKNETLKEAAVTMYAVSAEENIRLQCEARERYERDQRSNYAAGYNSGKQEGYDSGKQEGYNSGKQEGESRLASLINVLINNNRLDDIQRISSDSAFRNHLYKEFNL